MSSEISVIWSKLLLTLNPDCTYSINSTNMYSYPTSFAKPTYPTTAGQQQQYSSQHTVSFPYELNNRGEEEKLFATDFTGFTQMLSAAVFPPYMRSPLGRSAETPANYSFNVQPPSSFRVISPPNGCTYTYHMTSGPAFANMNPSPCSPGDLHCPETCPAGKYKAQITLDNSTTSVGSGYVCAFCPAGTISTADSSSSSSTCEPCPGATVAAAVGSASCQACAPPYFPSHTQSACIRCKDSNPSLPDNAIYNEGTSCTPQECPTGSIATVNNECIAGDSRKLCVAKSAASAPSSSSRCSAWDSSAAPLGGAILQLLSSETSRPGCNSDVAQLAEWLQGKSTYMGFNLTGVKEPTSRNEGSAGVQWQLLGSLEGSGLGTWTICGLAHGGPSPQAGLTLEGTALSKYSARDGIGTEFGGY